MDAARGSARSPFAAAPVTAITLDEYAVQWWSLYACPNLTAKTVDGYRRLWAAHVTPALGALELGALTPLLLEQWKAQLLAQGVGPESVKRTMIMLQGGFSAPSSGNTWLPIRSAASESPHRTAVGWSDRCHLRSSRRCGSTGRHAATWLARHCCRSWRMPVFGLVKLLA